MKVLILGGGASGLMAALSAAQDERNTVTVLERQSRVGRKLLATGNGRCNLTNLDLSPVHYHGQDAGFARAALSRFDGTATLDFFPRAGPSDHGRAVRAGLSPVRSVQQRCGRAAVRRCAGGRAARLRLRRAEREEKKRAAIRSQARTAARILEIS